jgi:hypothetical protein
MKNSSFAGFLDGYKSRNIASIESVLYYKMAELKDLLVRLTDEINKIQGGNHIEVLANLNRNIILLRERNHYDVIDQLYAFGESLKMNLKSLIDITDPGIKEKVNSVIVSFLELARLSEDPKLISLAIQIGMTVQR